METKDLLNYLGIEADSIDNFKQKFSEIYDKRGNIDREAVSQEVGRLRGSLEVAIKRLAKEYGAEFDQDEIKDKKTEDIVGIAFNKIKSKSLEEINKIKEESRKSKPADIQEWEMKVQKLNDKLGQLEATNNLLKDEMAKKEHEYLNSIKNTKLELQKNNMWGQIKFRHDIDDLTKKGFQAYISEKYKLDIDDKDQMVILDKDGKFIPDSTKHGVFKSPIQVIMDEAISKNIIEKNPDGGKKINTIFAERRQTQNPELRQVIRRN